MSLIVHVIVCRPIHLGLIPVWAYTHIWVLYPCGPIHTSGSYTPVGLYTHLGLIPRLAYIYIKKMYGSYNRVGPHTHTHTHTHTYIHLGLKPRWAYTHTWALYPCGPTHLGLKPMWPGPFWPCTHVGLYISGSYIPLDQSIWVLYPRGPSHLGRIPVWANPPGWYTCVGLGS